MEARADNPEHFVVGFGCTEHAGQRAVPQYRGRRRKQEQDAVPVARKKEKAMKGRGRRRDRRRDHPRAGEWLATGGWTGIPHPALRPPAGALPPKWRRATVTCREGGAAAPPLTSRGGGRGWGHGHHRRRRGGW